MSRITRNEFLYKGCYAHVISRSIRKLKIFEGEEDFQKFKEILLSVKKKAKFRLFHYCIMQTHFHLAVEMGEIKDFSYALRDLKRSYVYWFHKKYKLSGPLWRERFRSLLIEDNAYLYGCGQYIENNPVKAGLVQRSEDWAHSSAKHYLHNAPDSLIDSYDSQLSRKKDLTIDKEEFETGNVIGSSFFRFQYLESRKNSRRVPQ